ncbi:GFA family protein [Corallincola spongiicola]|uniref:GFA family protein n=1 Tax=Corallincola spongiicola TaxID=2520508 RepID=A0ABY1WS06_9GAMM|nr:GFA family protein [Corallincola spongiicola]TAA47526.1 GFA family protein [Corallincola spongiicola]
MYGQCLCGAIAFEVSSPTKWSAHCHCSRCRQAHGAAFVTWFGVSAQQVKLMHEDNTLRWFDSSENAQRGFCSTCGSTLFFRSERWPGELHIALAAMQEPIDRPVSAHVYFDSHVPWLTDTDELPKYGGDSGTEPLSQSEEERR